MPARTSGTDLSRRARSRREGFRGERHWSSIHFAAGGLALSGTRVLLTGEYPTKLPITICDRFSKSSPASQGAAREALIREVGGARARSESRARGYGAPSTIQNLPAGGFEWWCGERYSARAVWRDRGSARTRQR